MARGRFGECRPTDDVYAVLERASGKDGGQERVRRELRRLDWGLVPSWANDPKTGFAADPPSVIRG
ncbi:hypothetical protein ABZ092_00410 [Streptomyces bobili]|uniref:hypothetical protein n=1 Tax=Streptomyces bobili TaxID=67280 RepID=UPI00339E2874